LAARLSTEEIAKRDAASSASFPPVRRNEAVRRAREFGLI
jgi:hypothetical protein